MCACVCRCVCVSLRVCNETQHSTKQYNAAIGKEDDVGADDDDEETEPVNVYAIVLQDLHEAFFTYEALRQAPIGKWDTRCA